MVHEEVHLDATGSDVGNAGANHLTHYFPIDHETSWVSAHADHLIPCSDIHDITEEINVCNRRQLR